MTDLPTTSGEAVVTGGEGETRSLGPALLEALAPDGVLLLYGDMGAGKTVLVQGLAAALGVDPARVQSPTFTLIHEYPCAAAGVERLVHVDLYRLEGDQIEASGVLDALDAPQAIKVVEWSERLPFSVAPTLCLRLEAAGEHERTITAVEEAAVPSGC